MDTNKKLLVKIWVGRIAVLVVLGLGGLLAACAGAEPAVSTGAGVIFETVTPAPSATPKIIKIPAPATDSGPPPLTTPRASAPAALSQQLVETLNRERMALGLTLYQIEPRLTRLSQSHAADMAGRGYFDHITPEGQSYSQRLASADFSPVYRGENIYLSVEPAETAVADAVGWWLASGPHRENLLHPELTHLGVGVAETPEGWFIFVVDLIQE
jgi:uncharacterized protein YkwD